MTAHDDHHPTFNAMYFDSNILIGHRWPEPRPVLHNLLWLARWWGIAIFVPEPTLAEVGHHWTRKVSEAMTGVRSASRDLRKAASPLRFDVKVEHPDLTALSEQFEKLSERAIAEFGARRSGFTPRSAQDLFGYAARYLRPFATDGEGKGFQDAVILLSVLDHVREQDGTAAVLVTNDRDFRKLDYTGFAPEFDASRLRVVDFDSVFNEVYRPYFDETRSKPYRKLVDEAERLVRSPANELADFVRSNITPDMLRPSLGDTVREIVSVERVDTRGIDIPFSDGPLDDATVDIAIRVLVTCKAVVATDFAAVRAFFGDMDVAPQPPKEQEKMLSGYGLIEGVGRVEAGELREIVFSALAKDDL